MSKLCTTFCIKIIFGHKMLCRNEIAPDLILAWCKGYSPDKLKITAS